MRGWRKRRSCAGRSRSATTSPATRSSCTCRRTRRRWSCRCRSRAPITTLGGDVGDLLPVGATLLELTPDRRERPRAPASPANWRQQTRHTWCNDASSRRAGTRGAECRRRRRCGSWRGSWASTSRRWRAAARAGGSPPTTCAPPPRASRPRPAPLPSLRRASGGCRSAVSGARWPATWRRRGAPSRTSRCSTRSTLGLCSTRCVKYRELPGGASITLTAFFVRASVVALTAHPILNASLDEAADEIVYHDAIHVGIAVASSDGLVVPVVHDAQSLGLRRARRRDQSPHRRRPRRRSPARGDPRRHLHHHQLRHRRWTLRRADRPSAAGRDHGDRCDPPPARGRR